MKNKPSRLNLHELIQIFCDERNSLRSYYKEKYLKVNTYDSEQLIDYFIDKWIQDAKNCKDENDFNNLIGASLRMTFLDWYNSL